MKAALIAVLCFLSLALAGPSAHAASYYLTVAGLGGEPEYEQRFTSMANDLDRILKASGSEALSPPRGTTG